MQSHRGLGILDSSVFRCLRVEHVESWYEERINKTALLTFVRVSLVRFLSFRKLLLVESQYASG